MTIDSVIYGTSLIQYVVRYADRKTLGITVHPDGLVIIKAPIDTSKEVIKEKVSKRASWILKQQVFFSSFGNRMPERRYISGESHLYLGKQYLLRVTEEKPNSVSFKRALKKSS
jgi:predicted metal-dependent hydrolase